MTTVKTNKERGQLLIEALVAISVMMIGMLSVFGVLSESLSLGRVAADRYIAANLASEGIEIVRNMVNSEYLENLENPETGFPRAAFGDSIPMDAANTPCAVDINTEPAYEGGASSWNCGDDVPSLGFDGGLYSTDPTDVQQTKFKRYIEVSKSGDFIDVVSTVEWSGAGSGVSTVRVGDRFYNWRRAA